MRWLMPVLLLTGCEALTFDPPYGIPTWGRDAQTSELWWVVRRNRDNAPDEVKIEVRATWNGYIYAEDSIRIDYLVQEGDREKLWWNVDGLLPICGEVRCEECNIPDFEQTTCLR